MTSPFGPLGAVTGPIGWVAQPAGRAIGHAVVDPFLTKEQRAKVQRQEQIDDRPSPSVSKVTDTVKYVAIAAGVVALAYALGPAARNVGSRL